MTHISAPRRFALGAVALSCTGLALLVPSNAGAVETRPEATQNVAIAKFRFVPDNVGIDIGDKVRWVNTDEAEHRIRWIRGPRPFGMEKKQTLQRGESWKHQFRREGTYIYECTIHGERGEVRVGPDEHTAAPKSTGYGWGSLEPVRPR